MASLSKRDVIIDPDLDVDNTRFYLRTEDAVAWAADQDDLTLAGNYIEVPHAQAAEVTDRMKEDGLTFS